MSKLPNSKSINLVLPPEQFEVIEVDCDLSSTEEEKSWPVVRCIQNEAFEVEEFDLAIKKPENPSSDKQEDLDRNPSR